MAGASDQRFDVFVSYRSSDRGQLQRVLDAFERHHLKCWLDQEQIPPGAPFPEALARGIESSRALVVFVSTADLGSHWVSQEVNLALAREKRIIPARLEPFDVRRLPGFLAMLQCVDLTDGPSRERELDRLCRSLGVDGAAQAPSGGAAPDAPAPEAPRVDEDKYSRFLSHDLERKRAQVRRLQRQRLLPMAPLGLAGAAVAAYWATTAGAPSILGLVLVGLIGVEGLIWTTTESPLQRALHEQQQIEQLRDGLEACRGDQHAACGRLREKFWAIVERSTALS